MKPKEKINQLYVIRAINEIGEKYFSHTTRDTEKHEAYLAECNEILIKYITEELGGKYLFYVLTFMTKSGRLGFVPKCLTSKDNNKYHYHPLTPSGIIEVLENEYLPDIEEENIISMTQSTLIEKKGPDLIFESSPTYSEPIKAKSKEGKIGFLNLSNLDYNSDNNQILSNSEYIETIGKRLSIKGDEGQIRNLLCYYKKIEEIYLSKFTDKKFLVHFIRPYFVESEYNLLFSLATNDAIDSKDMAFIDLILYKIAGLMATEGFKEIERLKRIKSFSLTTHSLKTQLDTTVNKLYNSFIENHPELVVETKELGDELDELYRLTSLLSLLDKIEDKDKFCKAGIRYGLLHSDKVSFSIENIKHHIQSLNGRFQTMPDVEVVCDNNGFGISIKAHDHYFTETLIKLFFNTLFENLIQYGKSINDKIDLKIEQKSNILSFSSEMEDEKIEFDGQRLKGNLKLFKTLIEETKSGSFEINPKNYQFLIEIKQSENE